MENQKAKAKINLEKHWIRKWFRQKYNLSPKDPLFLGMTDEEIEIDYLEDKILSDEISKDKEIEQPHCPECGYGGHPYPNSTLCIECGGNMIVPGKTFGEDIEEDLEEIGIHLNPDEKILINT